MLQSRSFCLPPLTGCGAKLDTAHRYLQRHYGRLSRLYCSGDSRRYAAISPSSNPSATPYNRSWRDNFHKDRPAGSTPCPGIHRGSVFINVNETRLPAPAHLAAGVGRPRSIPALDGSSEHLLCSKLGTRFQLTVAVHLGHP
jgi:hypothetical protein